MARAGHAPGLRPVTASTCHGQEAVAEALGAHEPAAPAPQNWMDEGSALLDSLQLDRHSEAVGDLDERVAPGEAEVAPVERRR